MSQAPTKIFLVIKQYSNGVDSWETVHAAFFDETEAECFAIDELKALGHFAYEFFVQPIDVR